jgi:hypothetical protein
LNIGRKGRAQRALHGVVVLAAAGALVFFVPGWALFPLWWFGANGILQALTGT